VRLTRRRILLLGAVACVGAGGAYTFGIEPIWLRKVELDVRLERLAPAFRGFTIAQISDFHVGAGVPLDYLHGAADLANAEKPDLVALTGDYVHQGGDPKSADEAAAVVKTLEAPAYAVLGNHDRAVYSARGCPDGGAVQRIRDALERAGVRVLVNERITLRRGDARLHVAGLGDLWLGTFRPDDVPLRDATGPTIALSHNPDTAHDLAGRGADLILSGHTHGGQVSIPFLGPPILPVRHREFAAGHFQLGDTQLYVNRGVGWLRRVRLFVRPEVTILRLRSA
jgi:predicted MPP superfamily phosphohydrolase